MKKLFKFIIVGIFIIAQTVFGQQQKTPIMGWSSWNNYRIHINEEIILKQADAMVSSGLKKVGYNYVNIDDGYFGGRDALGNLFCDSIKFPNGMKFIADYIHSKGLKAGIYSEAGANTCGSIWDNDEKGVNVGLWKHDAQDLNLFFNKWGYDFLKVDWCGGEKQKLNEEVRYLEIIDHVRATKKNIIFNICRWQFPGTWAIHKADSWRISGDISENFESILHIINKNTYLSAYASPGHFNDMDMLQVGRGMTFEEDKAHFSMWCIMASPLLAGNDLSNMSKKTIEILTNTEMIAINQDVAGIQAIKKRDEKGVQLWVKPLGDRMSKTRAITILNTTQKDRIFSLHSKEIGLTKFIKIRDVWEHKNLTISGDSIAVNVPSHSVIVYKVEGSKALIPEKYEAENAYLNNFVDNPLNQDLKVVVNSNASGKAVVTGLGGATENWIEFQHIYAENNGKYKLKLIFLGSKKGKFKLYVNNKAVKTYNLFNEPKIKLNKGYNSIRIVSEKQKLPDFDKLEIINMN